MIELCFHDFASRQASQEEEHDVGDCSDGSGIKFNVV